MRKLGLVLMGLGVFLLVAGPMVRFYMYPKLAVAPDDQDSITTLVGPDATIFDIATLSEITTDLTTKVATVGDVEAAEKQGDNVVVWLSTTSSRSSDGVIRSRDIELSAFDATTAEAVNCCGEYVSTEQGEEVPVEHEGLLVKFPFDAQKTSYDWWDGTLERTVPIEYVATEEVAGITTYKYEQTIPATKVGETEAPASVLGEPDDGNLTADNMYSNVRTLWAEPNTGVIIKRVEQQNSTLDYDGTTRVTTTEVTTGYDDATIQANADEYGPKGSLLHLLRAVLPWLLPVVGLLLVVLGLLLTFRGRTRASPTGDGSATPSRSARDAAKTTA